MSDEDAAAWRAQRKIVSFPDDNDDPVRVLARTLEKAKAGHIKSVIVAIEWKNGGMMADWSAMPLPTTSLLIHVLTYNLHRWIEENAGPKVGPDDNISA